MEQPTRLNSALKVIAPLAVALLLTRMEPLLAALAKDRPGIIPVGLLALAACLLLPYARRFIVIVLCFGVALLAVNDSFRTVILPTLPAAIDYESVNAVYQVVDKLYPFGWATLAALAAAAGFGQALYPDAVWPRRCYFGAAALYFLAHGLLSFMKGPNWQSAAMIVVGCVALSGAILADRLAPLDIEPESEEEDVVALVESRESRASRIAAREWRDPAEESASSH
jgi:hypothetical protein